MDNTSPDSRLKAKKDIFDILQRLDNERPTEVWHSDIRRMADLLIWIYNEWSKPCVYDLGNRIEFKNSDIEAIEKRNCGYFVTVSGSERNLSDISDADVLWPLLHALIKAEFKQWDYCVDMCRGEYRTADGELRALLGENEKRLYARYD